MEFLYNNLTTIFYIIVAILSVALLVCTHLLAYNYGYIHATEDAEEPDWIEYHA